MGIGGEEGAVDDAAVLHVGGEEAERFLGGLQPGDGGAFRQRMGLGDEQAVALLVERRLQQAFDRLVVEIGDAGLDGEIMQCTEDFLGAMREHGEFDRRRGRPASPWSSCDTMGSAEGMTPITRRPTSSPVLLLIWPSSCCSDCQLSRMRWAHLRTRSPSGVRPI